MPQGISADLIATLEGFSREMVDAYAVESQRRAAAAQVAGHFHRSIVPVRDVLGEVVLARVEYLRPGTTLADLAKLKPAFTQLGEDGGFDAVAEFDQVWLSDEKIGIIPFFGTSRMVERHVPFTCEADVLRALSMLVLEELAGHSTFLEHYILDYQRNQMFNSHDGHDNPALADKKHGVRIVPTIYYKGVHGFGASFNYAYRPPCLCASVVEMRFPGSSDVSGIAVMHQSLRFLRASVPLWWLLLAVALLPGCGFQLRSAESLRLPARLSPMYLNGVPDDDPLRRELTTALSEYGEAVAENREVAQSFLVLSGRENRRRVLAVNAQGRAIEYEMVEAVTVELLDRDRNVLLPEYRVVKEGTYTRTPRGTPSARPASSCCCATARGATTSSRS